MLETSWRAKGLIRPIWLRLDVKKDKRGELARRTGIPATNLSGLNRGRLPMTPELADRIIAAVPGTMLDDLRPRTSDEETEGLGPLTDEEIRGRFEGIATIIRQGEAHLDAKLDRVLALVTASSRLEDQSAEFAAAVAEEETRQPPGATGAPAGEGA